MSRAGRKRDKAKRKDAVPIATTTAERVPTPNQVARTQPHRMRLYEDVAHDARAMTSLGQLNLIGAIPNDLYAAGQRLARVVRHWREVVDAPRMPPSIAGVGQPAGVTGSDIEDAKERRDAYNDAMGGLATASKAAKAITLWVVVEGGRVPANGFRPLMDGLRALKQSMESRKCQPLR